ncbi:MAG: radical SAM/SPASM domain-containing protein [Alphaproteobacteria bacterium]|nr:radical SAM/SPASM domain-containing protein [Alphaproteobacteria bacterium]
MTKTESVPAANREVSPTEARSKEYLRQRISPDEDFEALLEFPRFFEIETVNTCNARCPMCTIESWTRHSPVMSMDTFTKIADEISEYTGQVHRVSLFKDGEPLLDKKLPRRIALLKERGVENVAIHTNVSLLDEKRAPALLEAGLDEITLSIDSLDKEVFEKIREGLTLEVVLENAMKFIELRNRIRPQAEIKMRMIKQDSNKDEWEAYKAFWQDRLAPHDRCFSHNIHNWGGQLEGHKHVAESLQPQVPCLSLWSAMVIFSDGNVPMCTVDFNNTHPTGSVVDSSIKELWDSPVMMKRRQIHMEHRRGVFPNCRTCNVWDEPSDYEKLSDAYVKQLSVETG